MVRLELSSGHRVRKAPVSAYIYTTNVLTVDEKLTVNLQRRRQLAVCFRCQEDLEILIVSNCEVCRGAF